MIYVENNSMEAAFSFAMEYYFIKEKDLGGDVFSFWRTEPTLMIGRYQITAAEINEVYAKEKGIKVVRRLSGGGTIYTDPRGWQFTFITRDKEHVDEGFRKFTAPILDALHNLGIQANLSDRNDLLIDGRKFSGNAQYRDKNCVLHHGSLLFDTDLEELVRSITVADDKIISKGIQSIRQRVTNISEHMSKKIDPLIFRDLMLKNILGEKDTTYILTEEDIKNINTITDSMFRTWEWNYGESPDYQVTKSRRFGGGKLEVRLNLADGRITDCRLLGDFFFYGEIGVLEKSLVGCPLRGEEIRTALAAALQGSSFFMITLDELVECIMQ